MQDSYLIFQKYKFMNSNAVSNLISFGSLLVSLIGGSVWVGVLSANLGRQAERSVLAQDIVAKDEDTLEIGLQGHQAGGDRVIGVVFTLDDGHGCRWRGSGAIGHGPAGGDAGAQVEGDKRFAPAWVAVEHGEFAQGEPVGPEPIQRAADDLG